MPYLIFRLILDYGQAEAYFSGLIRRELRTVSTTKRFVYPLWPVYFPAKHAENGLSTLKQNYLGFVCKQIEAQSLTTVFSRCFIWFKFLINSEKSKFTLTFFFFLSNLFLEKSQLICIKSHEKVPSHACCTSRCTCIYCACTALYLQIVPYLHTYLCSWYRIT